MATFCGVCGQPMTMSVGEASYDQSGLDDVQLLNVPIWTCPNGHREVIVPAIDALNDLLSELILAQPAKLNGKEIRFLRKYLGYSSKEFAERIAITPQALSRLENCKTKLSKRLELLVRLFCAQVLAESKKRPYPKNLLAVLEQLEGTLDVGTHRVEHVTDNKPITGPTHEWREAQ